VLLASSAPAAIDHHTALAAWRVGFEAAARAGEVTTDIIVANARVRIRIASASLAEVLLPALRHLVVPNGGAPALTICACDEAETGVRPAYADALGRGANDHTFIVGERRFIAMEDNPVSSICAYDRDEPIALYWTNAADAVQPWKRCKPFLLLFHWWLLACDWQPVHAAAVGGKIGGLLIGGRTGAGKSTTALACVRAGWTFAGDDYVLIGTDPIPRVEPLFASARLKADMVARMPNLAAAHAGTPTVVGREKVDLVLLGTLSQDAFGGFPARAIVLPRVRAGGRTTVRPASPAEAMTTLMPGTLHALRGGSGAAFAKIARFVAALPVFRVDVGSDLAEIPEVLAREFELGLK